MTAADWRGLTGPNADPRVRDALVQLYRESVWAEVRRALRLVFIAPTAIGARPRRSLRRGTPNRGARGFSQSDAPVSCGRLNSN
jgi:hypothetical protein